MYIHKYIYVKGSSHSGVTAVAVLNKRKYMTSSSVEDSVVAVHRIPWSSFIGTEKHSLDTPRGNFSSNRSTSTNTMISDSNPLTRYSSKEDSQLFISTDDATLHTPSVSRKVQFVSPSPSLSPSSASSTPKKQSARRSFAGFGPSLNSMDIGVLRSENEESTVKTPHRRLSLTRTSSLTFGDPDTPSETTSPHQLASPRNRSLTPLRYYNPVHCDVDLPVLDQVRYLYICIYLYIYIYIYICI
jgi:hypothetical protein